MNGSGPVYSIGSGTVRPSDLAVLRLMYKLTLVDCWTGIVAGFSPLRIKTFGLIRPGILPVLQLTKRSLVHAGHGIDSGSPVHI